MNSTKWIRSSFCGPQHNCVELSHGDAGVIIRDSKATGAAVLIFDRAPWSIFVKGCHGRYDQLASTYE